MQLPAYLLKCCLAWQHILAYIYKMGLNHLSTFFSLGWALYILVCFLYLLFSLQSYISSQWNLALGKPLEYYYYLFMKSCHLLWFSDIVEADMGISLGSSWRGADTTAEEFSFDKGHKLGRIFRWFLNSQFNQTPDHIPACLLVMA